MVLREYHSKPSGSSDGQQRTTPLIDLWGSIPVARYLTPTAREPSRPQCPPPTAPPVSADRLVDAGCSGGLIADVRCQETNVSCGLELRDRLVAGLDVEIGNHG
jgi:hypothetical protein